MAQARSPTFSRNEIGSSAWRGLGWLAGILGEKLAQASEQESIAVSSDPSVKSPS